MLDHTIAILPRLTKAFSLPIIHYCGEFPLHTWANNRFSHDISLLYAKPFMDCGKSIYMVTSSRSVISGFIDLPENGEYLIIGPAIPFDMSPAQCAGTLAELGLSEKQAADLQFHFQFLPHMSTNNFAEAMRLIWSVVYPGQQEPPEIQTFQYQAGKNIPSVKSSREENFYLQEAENFLLSIVSNGRESDLDPILDSLLAGNDTEYGLAQIGTSRIRALKNTLISSATLISRAAVKGGYDYTSALKLSDYYINRIEQSDTVSALHEMLGAMLHEFTHRVALLQIPESDSSVVSAVYRDVAEHRHEKLLPSDIAEHLSFNISYISHCFKAETGKTLTEYIQEQKINEACYHLENSDLSLAEIAAALGYSSQQQFQSIFKRVTGETPAVYRRKKSIQ